MQIGFSSYSFHAATSAGRMTLPDVVDWIAESPGEHLEIAVGFPADSPLADLSDLPNNHELLEALAARLDATGVNLSQLAMPGNLWQDDEEKIEEQKANMRRHIDLAAELGIKLLRHDVSHGNHPGDDSLLFDEALPVIAKHAKEVAQYGATKGVTTSIENHGYFVQGSERVRRVIHAVDEPNFKTTLDIGNFLCTDEEPVVAVKNNLPYASIVHLKDFYVRTEDPGEGFFKSRGGRFLRGAIVGQGDIDMRGVIGAVKESGYDGFVSIEFEGHEDPLVGCSRGIKNAIRLFDEV
jgi:sugar phosphate isomerase/epimerase